MNRKSDTVTFITRTNSLTLCSQVQIWDLKKSPKIFIIEDIHYFPSYSQNSLCHIHLSQWIRLLFLRLAQGSYLESLFWFHILVQHPPYCIFSSTHLHHIYNCCSKKAIRLFFPVAWGCPIILTFKILIDFQRFSNSC